VGKVLFFFRSGWVQAINYLFLVVGGVGDTWIYLKFCIFFSAVGLRVQNAI